MVRKDYTAEQIINKLQEVVDIWDEIFYRSYIKSWLLIIALAEWLYLMLRPHNFMILYNK